MLFYTHVTHKSFQEYMFEIELEFLVLSNSCRVFDIVYLALAFFSFPNGNSSLLKIILFFFLRFVICFITGGIFGSVIREFWNFWGSNIVAPKVFCVAGELVGRREKSEQWQKRLAGKIERHFSS